MSYESYPQHSQTEERKLIRQLRGTEQHRELISQLRGIRVTLIVGLIVLMLALAPWWLIGMRVLMAEAGLAGD